MLLPPASLTRLLAATVVLVQRAAHEANMGTPQSSYNATLWAVGSPWDVTCFRVVVDAAGRVIRSSVHDFNDAVGTGDFEERLRTKLHARYGESLTIQVVLDGGASFASFRRAVAAGERPVPPAPEDASEPPTKGQPGLWDDAG